MKKWQLCPKNVITQILQRPYNLISILAESPSPGKKPIKKISKRIPEGKRGTDLKKEKPDQAKKDKPDQVKKEKPDQTKKEKSDQVKKDKPEPVKKEKPDQAKKEKLDQAKKEKARYGFT